MSETFMKERPILPLLASMALPMVLSMLVNSLYNIVDSFFVAKISEEAMTALSLVYPVQNFINAVAIGFGVGINAVIAIGLGAGDRRRADAAAAQGIALSALHGLVLTAACIAIMPSFLARFTSDPAVIQMGLQYSGIAFSFSVIIMLGLSFEKLFQAVGRMKITMAALLAGCIANIILDPLLIFGPGPFPELGISGAALATGIGQVLTLAVYLAAYRLFPIPVRLRRSCLKPYGPLIRKLYAVGVPAILNLALPSLLISVLNGLLSVYSQSYVTILGIYYKLQTFLYLPASGVVQGLRPLIGYNYGAGEHGRVRQLYNCRPADHLRGLSHLRRVRHLLRSPGGTGQGKSVPGHLPVPVRGGHPTRRLPPVPGDGTKRGMARLLDHRGHYRRGGVLGVSEDGEAAHPALSRMPEQPCTEIWLALTQCQYAQTAVLFPPYCVDFPCNTQSIAASNRLVWQKNPSPSGTFPIFKQGLAQVIKIT